MRDSRGGFAANRRCLEDLPILRNWFILGAIMKLKSAILGLLVLSSDNSATGQVPASLTQASVPRKLVIHPTSTSVAGGTASLTIGALRRKAAAYIGEYDLKVSPWYFKNETGKLLMIVPEEALRKLMQGIAVSFTGKATTDADGTSRSISARATPSGSGQGSVTFSFVGDERKVTFNTTYHFRDE